jgi:hypothetical protein
MKIFKTVTVITVLFVFLVSGVSLVTAQTVKVPISQDISEWVQCANDGLSETVSGTIDVDLLFHYDKDGNQTKLIAHPHAGILIGQTTGTIFRATGVTLFLVDNNPDKGAFTDTFINRYHFVGQGGIRFWVFDTIHTTTNANGIPTATVEFIDASCK